MSGVKRPDLDGKPSLERASDGGYSLTLGGLPVMSLLGTDPEWAFRLLRLAEIAYRNGRRDKEEEIRSAQEMLSGRRPQKAVSVRPTAISPIVRKAPS